MMSVVVFVEMGGWLNIYIYMSNYKYIIISNDIRNKVRVLPPACVM